MADIAPITLCAIDTRTPGLALRALEISRRRLPCQRVLLLTDREHAAGMKVLPGIEVGLIDPLGSTADYSNFMLTRLLEFVTTSHVLVVQWDGFVLDGRLWEPGFLAADYLGAPWRKGPRGHVVGNGGFSLRSRRLLRALADPEVRARHHHPEDICIGQTLRPWLEQRHGIVFGTAAQAQRFAFERLPAPGPTFGFHGMVNLPRALGPDVFEAWLGELPDAMLAGRDAFKTARELLRRGDAGLALGLLERRATQRRLDPRSAWMRWCARRLVAAAAAPPRRGP